ncbi:MAG: FUSC family protein [Roseburia sp.]|nr:FUSC family protein [Roseburia sp.]
MHIKKTKLHIGLRTVKTATAVVIAMVIVNAYGATTSRLIFAMLGAMVAMEPTFKGSVKSCLTQIIGVLFGASAGVLLLLLPIHPLVAAGIGIVLVITLYNLLRIRFSPTLPCLILATICTTPDIQPLTYALGRIWDTAIGLSVGMLINTLIFPYDNSQKICSAAESLEREVLVFLEDMFDGDDILPNTEKMARTIDDMARQLSIFSDQWLLLRLKRNRNKLKDFQISAGKARQLVAQMEVLCRMEQPGRLSDENRKRLKECGANILDQRTVDEIQELDIITNYHVEQILTLRQELLDVLRM